MSAGEERATAPAGYEPAHRRPADAFPGPTRRVRTPRVLQMDEVECGPAALGIVLGHHGMHVPLEELRIRCGVSRDGSKAGNVLQAARNYGLRATGMQMSVAALTGVPAPAILFWDFYHFVVWEGFGRRFGKPVAYINDPAEGRRAVSADEFDGSFTGVVLTFTPGRQFRRGGQRPNLLRDLPGRLRGAGPALTVVLLAGLLTLVAGLAEPGFTRAFFDGVLTAGHSTIAGPLLLAMSVALAASLGLSLLAGTHLMRAQISASTLASARFMRHLLRLPLPFFHQRSPADVGQRLDSNDSVTRALTTAVLGTVSSVVVLVTYSILLWAYDVRLTLFGSAVLAANLTLVYLIMRVRAAGTARVRIDEARLMSASYSGLHLIETMKATGGEDGYFRRWSGLHARLLTGRQQVSAPVQLLAALTPALAVAGDALILMTGALSVIAGALSIGVLVAFQSLLREVESPVATLADLGPRLQDVGADAAKLRDVEDFGEDQAFARPQSGRARRLTGTVSVRDVSFGYSGMAPPVLRDLSFGVLPGQQVALVGGSGSGKSTVSRLLTGLYEAWTGQILFDGEPVASIDRGVLASSVAFVDQEIHLFAGSVRDNVTLLDPTILDEAVEAALRDAELYDTVASRPGGLHARVEQDGRNFSGGQRQRLEIARALARDPAVLVLDEATSALDAETEHVIAENLRRRGCTRIVIAHRLSTIRDSDEILVLDGGAVVERGTHRELLSRGGRYAQLAPLVEP
ncbi:MAG: putative transporter [Actinomycetia bacterium]|nr:putative transporter [Actinomycetes bacterium]